MDFYESFRTEEEVNNLMAKIGKDILEIIATHVDDEESSISVASMMLKYTIALYRGVLSEDDILETLEYALESLKDVPPVYPPIRQIH